MRYARCEALRLPRPAIVAAQPAVRAHEGLQEGFVEHDMARGAVAATEASAIAGPMQFSVLGSLAVGRPARSPSRRQRPHAGSARGAWAVKRYARRDTARCARRARRARHRARSARRKRERAPTQPTGSSSGAFSHPPRPPEAAKIWAREVKSRRDRL